MDTISAETGTDSTSRPRRILITGGSRGIGFAAAKVLAKSGNRLVLASRSAEHLESAREEICKLGREPELLAVDLTDPGAIARAAQSVLSDGPIDVLINCAGMLTQALVVDRSDDDLQHEMSLNYFGVVRLTRCVLPAMIARRAGTIVNVSSLLAQVGTATTANYSASKAAVEAFSTALRSEVKGHGVRVVVFVAPHTQTQLGKHADFRGVQSAPVDFVGAELAQAVDFPRDLYCAGTYLRVGRRLAAWAPGFMQRKLKDSVSHLL